MTETVNTKCMHVFLLDAPEKVKGAASVSGALFESDEDSNDSIPVANVPVYLADARDGCYIAAGLTGEKGEFSFFNLQAGEYCLKVDHNGTVKCDERVKLKIDSDGLQVDVTANLNRSRMITSVTENRSSVNLNPLEDGLSFDPNPSLDGMLNLSSIETFKRLKLEISDLSGWIVMMRDLVEIQPGYTESFDLGNLEKGTYLLDISTYRDRLLKQLILQ